MINKGEAKDYLMAAENDFSKGDYVNVLINCRKAIYVEFETDYDISLYGDEREKIMGTMAIMLTGMKAPFYVCNKKYIDEYVKEPTDYIVYDHDRLDMDLLRAGISRVDYWNVWRLTPSLYRKNKESDWIVKKDFQKLDEEGIKDRAEYVLDSSINLILTKHLDIKRSKSPDYKKYYVSLKNESVPIYEKADNKSKVVGTVPANCKKVFVDSKVSALNGKGIFWHVVHVSVEDNFYLWGYIDNDDIINSN